MYIERDSIVITCIRYWLCMFVRCSYYVHVLACIICHTVLHIRRPYIIFRASYPGMSNYNLRHTRELLGYSEIKPAVSQFEIHPFNTRNNLVAYIYIYIYIHTYREREYIYIYIYIARATTPSGVGLPDV